jgi:electron transfer flavoprotein alpha subunit
MITLLLADHDGLALSTETAKALTAARALGAPVHVLVAGKDARPAAEAAALLDGVAKVLLAEAPAVEGGLAEPLATLVVALAPGYDAIVSAATATGKSTLPRVAALIDVAQVSDVIAVDAPDTFRRPIYAGNAIQTVRSRDAVKVLTVRTTAFAESGPAASPAPVERIDAAAATHELSRLLGEEVSASERPDLGAARIVVSGGRALGSRERFDDLLFPLADKLGAAVGASRAAVDSGYAANDLQVGQTGKVVAPELYIALGISGAIQHLAGMKDSKVIVAINKDEEAPIFQVADYGLVADIFEAVPELVKAL